MKTNKMNAIFAATLLAGAGLFAACSKDDGPSLPPIGGYDKADDVSAANLLAHWGFEGSGKESKSGANPSNSVNATFKTGGPKGQVLDLASGYLAFEEIAALNSLKSFTVSAWVNIKNNNDGANVPTAFFSLSRPAVSTPDDEWIGSINLMSETGRRVSTSDTLIVKGLFGSKKPDGGADNQDTVNEPNNGGDQAFKGAGRWSHVVITYDGETSMFLVYGDGKKISNPDWEKRGTAGPITVFTPSRPIIGAWGTNLRGTNQSWQQPMTGQIDEIRIYNKALSPSDIGSLFQLESAGR